MPLSLKMSKMQDFHLVTCDIWFGLCSVVLSSYSWKCCILLNTLWVMGACSTLTFKCPIQISNFFLKTSTVRCPLPAHMLNLAKCNWVQLVLMFEIQPPFYQDLLHPQVSSMKSIRTQIWYHAMVLTHFQFNLLSQIQKGWTWDNSIIALFHHHNPPFQSIQW